jgi:hypothetical protein
MNHARLLSEAFKALERHDRGGIKMKAGRELDALIHEKIFGKCGHVLAVYKKDNKNAWMDDYTNYRCKKCKTATFRGLAYREGGTVCPNYSTKIEDAWLVVEKFPQIDICMSKVDDKWNCFIEFADHMATAETAPLAICIAALKACVVEAEG